MSKINDKDTEEQKVQAKSQRGNRASRRSHKKSMSKNKTSGSHLDKGTRDNDPNWYFTDPKLAEQVSQLSFQNMVGTGKINGKFEYPTIAKYVFNPAIGNTIAFGSGSESTDLGINAPVNAMAVKIYALLSSYTGRTSTYAPQDITTMICAQASLLEVIEATRRIFGILQTTNVRSRILPTKLVESMGISAADLYAHIPAYRMRFNSLITRANQMPLLGNVAMLIKSRDMFQRIYLDSPSAMAQIFYYIPGTAWQLDEDSYDGGTICKTVSLPFAFYQGANTLENVLDIIEDMLNALLESSTLQVVYSDLINLGNKTSLSFFSYDYLMEDYVVLPEFNQNALLQTHNMCILKLKNVSLSGEIVTTLYKTGTSQVWSGLYVTKENDIVPVVDANCVRYSPAFEVVTMSATDQLLIDFDQEMPSIEDKIEALRMSFMPKTDPVALTANATLANSFSVGATITDHYCTGLFLYDSVGVYMQSEIKNNFAAPNSDDLVYAMTQIEHAPLIRDYWNGRILGDINFWTTVPYEYLERVNNFMLLGLFDWR